MKQFSYFLPLSAWCPFNSPHSLRLEANYGRVSLPFMQLYFVLKGYSALQSHDLTLLPDSMNWRKQNWANNDINRDPWYLMEPGLPGSNGPRIAPNSWTPTQSVYVLADSPEIMTDAKAASTWMHKTKHSRFCTEHTQILCFQGCIIYIYVTQQWLSLRQLYE